VRDDFDAYRAMVLGEKGQHALGFPGPAQHGRAYNRLKERMIEKLLRETKVGHPRSARVLSLTGIRRAESKRRAKREPITRTGSMVFCNPLIDWTNADMRDYRAEHDLPESPVAALLHMSGECVCGSMSSEGEREMIRSLWPGWWEDRMAPIEREAEAQGIRYCRWGGFDLAGERAGDEDDSEPAGELCSSCALRGQLSLEGAA
jgi:3'-phosphoadenosine 5'-phosphosulfate sulfotransferase (PAPS reductase)/FAD synthetase